MKVGVYCHTRCIINKKEPVGKVYIIQYIEDDETFMIINDHGEPHFFLYGKKISISYLDYFYTLKDMRKIKIGKIYESNM